MRTRTVQGFVQRILWSVSLTAGLTAALIGGASLIGQHNAMSSSIRDVRRQAIDGRRRAVQDEALRAASYIAYQRASARRDLDERLLAQTRFLTAFARGMARHGSPTGPGAGHAALQAAVEAAHTGLNQGQLLVLDREGRCVLHAGHPSSNGSDMANARGRDGRAIVREILEAAGHGGEGRIEGAWSPPGAESECCVDVTHVARVEPPGWVVVAAGCTDDVSAQTRARILDYLSSVRFDNGGYVFAGQWDGVSLSGPARGRNMIETTDANGVKVVQELIRAAQQGGGFVEYVMPPLEGQRESRKLSYVVPVADWQWYVGSGCYLDDIEAGASRAQAGMVHGVLWGMVGTLLATLLSGLFALVSARRLAKAVGGEVRVFGEWLHEAHGDLREIDPSRLRYREFRRLAEDANAMVRSRRAAAEREGMLAASLQEARRLESLGVLAGGIAHSFNNLLAAILGNVELALAKVPEAAPVRANLDAAETAGKRARDLVRQILSFSRREAHEMKPVELRRLLEEVLEMLRGTVPSTIEVRTTWSVPDVVVIGDPSQLHQVVVNLAANGCHAIGDRDGILELSLGTEVIGEERARHLGCPSAGAFACISVRDTGHGIDDEALSRIFEPFFTTKAPGEGTGLGLSYSHGVVSAHGGAISAESVLGQGTTFRVYLPVAEAGAEPDSVDREPSLAGPLRVLVVDDEPSLLATTVESLELLGLEGRGCTSASEALRILSAEPEACDLVITDRVMPGMTGLELALQVKRMRADLPVLLATGYMAPRPAGEGGLPPGVDGLLAKPYSLGQLAQAVASVATVPSVDGR